MPKTTKLQPAGKPAPEASGAVAHEVMTLAEAAVWLRVPEDGLKREAATGQILARLVAGEWRFSKAALIAWLSVPDVPGRTKAKTGAELVARIEEINRHSQYKETPEEAEAFLGNLRKLRKTMWGAG